MQVAPTPLGTVKVNESESAKIVSLAYGRIITIIKGNDSLENKNKAIGEILTSTLRYMLVQEEGVATRDRQVTDLKNLIEKLNAMSSALSNEIDLLKAECLKKDAEADEIKNRCNSLNTEYQTGRQQFSNEIEEFRIEIQKLKENEDKALAIAKRVEEKLRKQIQTTKKVQKERDNAKAEMDKIKQKDKELQTKLKEAEKKIAQQEKAIKTLGEKQKETTKVAEKALAASKAREKEIARLKSTSWFPIYFPSKKAIVNTTQSIVVTCFYHFPILVATRFHQKIIMRDVLQVDENGKSLK